MIGALLKIGAGLVSAFNTVLGMFRDKGLRDQGATEQRAATDEATLDTINRVDAPISGAESDQLWDRNKAKYGTSDGSADKAK